MWHWHPKNQNLLPFAFLFLFCVDYVFQKPACFATKHNPSQQRNHWPHENCHAKAVITPNDSGFFWLRACLKKQERFTLSSVGWEKWFEIQLHVPTFEAYRVQLGCKRSRHKKQNLELSTYRSFSRTSFAQIVHAYTMRFRATASHNVINLVTPGCYTQ